MCWSAVAGCYAVCSIPLIPVNNISVEESYQRFCGAIQKAARHSIPRGFRPTYTPCLDIQLTVKKLLLLVVLMICYMVFVISYMYTRTRLLLLRPILVFVVSCNMISIRVIHHPLSNRLAGRL